MRIRTNDPVHPYLSVVITGFVDTFAELSKKHIRLVGQVSDRLSDQIVITPREEYPFIIEGAKARDGRNISFQIKEEMDNGKRRYILTVENIRKEKGSYADLIEFHINSHLRKTISIEVAGFIREAK